MRFLTNPPKWRIQDSNLRPLACHASALPTELIPQGLVDPKVSRTRKLCQVTTAGSQFRNNQLLHAHCRIHLRQAREPDLLIYRLYADLFVSVFFVPYVTEPHGQPKCVGIHKWTRVDWRLLTHFKSQLSITVIEFLDEYFSCFWHANVANHLVPLSQQPARSISFATG